MIWPDMLYLELCNLTLNLFQDFVFTQCLCNFRLLKRSSFGCKQVKTTDAECSSRVLGNIVTDIVKKVLQEHSVVTFSLITPQNFFSLIVTSLKVGSYIGIAVAH